ncbi:MFS transporter [Actinomyces viscosus]|uniref:MFS transporter n=1 Tax=Actinomyces viscosus TaxID=1656 RepID=A0ABT7TZJ0_ACTVI|nr:MULTISPECIES: MFS transporter [Actinomyces]MDM8077248.1 MFS transporter [Actinomyces viscosus]
MPSAPNTDDNGTDQPGTDPSTQPGAADSSDDASTAPDMEEAEAGADRNATEADQATTDTGESNGEAEGKNEGESFPPRGVLTMRALRWGGLFGAVVFGVTTLVLLLGFPDFGDPTPIMVILTTGPLLVGGTLVRLFLRMMDKKRPVLVTILTTIMAALGMAASAFVTLEWWDTYLKTGFSVLFLLTLAAMNLAITIPLSVTPLLHHLHSTMASASDPDSPSRWRRLHFKTGEKTSKGLPRYERVRVPRRTRRYLTALVIAPALTLGSAIVGTWALVNPVHHVTATSPADGSLTPPASLAPTATWTKEISSTELTTVAGAGGPILLTDEGIMALNPKDGSVLWSYEREHATFVPASSSTPNNRSLITSPDGKYVATRIRQHKFVASPPASDAAITLVFDALTGRIVFEHQGHGGTLQLTDSAVLDDDNAFSLTDGSQMWTLPEGSYVYYSGPAGHSSFIQRYSEDHTTNITPSGVEKAAVSITVFPQNNPAAEVEIQQILSEFTFEDGTVNDFSSFIEGWAARYTGEVDSSGNPMAEAISLDALAKVDGADAKTIPLGATSGINTEASHLSGSIVTYPVITADAASKRPHENARAATVFAPSTRTVTPASQDRSLAAARTGIVEVPAEDGSSSAALVIRPGDDSPGTTIPITPGSTFRSPQELADDNGIPAQPLFSRNSELERPTTVTRTPGVVIATLNVTELGYVHCSVGPQNDSQRCREAYQIFGLTGGQK